MLPIIQTTHYTVQTKKKVKLKAALVADLHNNDSTNIIDILKNEKPDIIIVAGDLMTFPYDEKRRETHSLKYKLFYFVYGMLRSIFSVFCQEKDENYENALEFLNRATKIAPVYYALGNHERGMTDEMRCNIKSTNTILLEDEWIKYKEIEIGGITSRYRDELKVDWIGKNEAYRIMICHNPEYAEFVSRSGDMDLILSGHAHGGQIRIAGRGLFAPGQGLFPKLTSGVYDIGNTKLIVSRGLANTATLIPRLWNKKEVVIIEVN